MRTCFICSTLALIVLLVSSSVQGWAQTSTMSDNEAYRTQLNAEYADGATSPLGPDELKAFTGLPFFPIDTAYAVTARLERSEKPITIDMPTTQGTVQKYDIFGIIYFRLQGVDHKLALYQSHRLRSMPTYERHLLLAFKDITSGNTTYGGGRFMDVEIPEGDSILIDFNKAYNPYCAYSTRFACPITPEDNFLNLEVKAGVRMEH
jgi:hypothetical protein